MRTSVVEGDTNTGGSTGPFIWRLQWRNEERSAQMWRCPVSRARLYFIWKSRSKTGLNFALGWKSRTAPGPRHRPGPARCFQAGSSGRAVGWPPHHYHSHLVITNHVASRDITSIPSPHNSSSRFYIADRQNKISTSFIVHKLYRY